MSSIKQLFIRYRRLTHCFLAALIALILYWNFARPSGFNVVLLVAQLLPLAALAPGLYSQYYRAYSWLCFVMLLYFVLAVMGAFASTASLVDYLFVLLSTALFISSMMCSRYAQRVQKNITD
ncbi:DUF2069 domain-containing protein [Agaribacterium sp. ZY112]|uniref:DUF2069 domain-containing protein n=1 Tax=Agaribacterium sp. ZY112 TaxID=3233574 RepID=UPI0035240AA5